MVQRFGSASERSKLRVLRQRPESVRLHLHVHQFVGPDRSKSWFDHLAV